MSSRRTKHTHSDYVDIQDLLAVQNRRRSHFHEPSAADDPAAVQPDVVQPAAVQPGAVQAGAVQPTTVQPAVVQPDAAQIDTVQLVTVQHDAVQPAVVQPGVVQPHVLSESGFDQLEAPTAAKEAAAETAATEDLPQPDALMVTIETAAAAGTAVKGASAKEAVIQGDSPQPQNHVKRKRKKRSRKVKPWQKVLLIAVCVLAAVAVGAVVAVLASSSITKATIQNVNDSATVANADDDAITYQGHKYKLNKDMVSILLIGHDDSEDATTGKTSQADMVAVVAFDTVNGAITVIGIPRDTKTLVDAYGTSEDGTQGAYAGQVEQQLCMAYALGTGEGAVDNVKACVERILYQVPISYYVDLNEDGIAAVNDAIGGVSLTALESIPGTSITEGSSVLLMGENAHKYVQYRDTSINGSSLDRQARQSQYIKAFISQAFAGSRGSAQTFIDLFGTLTEYADTNMDVGLIGTLAQTALTHGISSAQVTTLTGTLTNMGPYNAVVLDDANTMQVVVDTYFTKID